MEGGLYTLDEAITWFVEARTRIIEMPHFGGVLPISAGSK
jgi:hypothetical protein